MKNLSYNNGILRNSFGELVNLHQPFSNKISLERRRRPINSLLLSPNETTQTSTIRKFIVPFNKRYCYGTYVSYYEKFKCHSIYMTNQSIDKIIRGIALNYFIETIDNYNNAKHDLLKCLNLLVDAWEFDSIITDIPWLTHTQLPVIKADWSLVSYSKDNELATPMKLLLDKQAKILLEAFPLSVLSNITKSDTDIPDLKVKSPLILIRINRWYASFLASLFTESLPVTLFKITTA